MKRGVDVVRNAFKRAVHQVALRLNALTGGKLHPNYVTVFGFVMHVPIALLIGSGRWISAAILLFFFALFDTLDGDLARLQKSTSNAGGLLDASTDRMKEVLLYAGTAYWMAGSAHPQTAVWAVLACGASICVSYIKSKGETMVAAGGAKQSYAKLNRLFADGLLPFEIRMTLLFLGLLTGWLTWAVIIIAVLASFTAFQRLLRITRALDRDEA